MGSWLYTDTRLLYPTTLEMTMQYRAPRGTSDILPTDQKYWRYIEGKAQDLSGKFGYARLDTPIFEDSGLFVRSVGEGTDIVEKEMYTFNDRGGDSNTLRPEGTAPVCRAYLEHGMQNLPQPVRLYYFCPVFRYERPQAGRYREHHQYGAEVLGDGGPSADAEVVEMAWALMGSLGLSNLSLVVNSIGDGECRPAYIEELKTYYSLAVDHLCKDCLDRLDRNPLRLLDCKQPSCQKLGMEAPRSVEHLCTGCQDHWDSFRRYLDIMEMPYRIDHHLVRGLDYYTRTVFEIQPEEEGSQSTICGGGRYDALIEQIGGKPTPGIGFATGMERLVLNLKRQEVPVPEGPAPSHLVVSVGEGARDAAVGMAAKMRRLGVSAILGAGSRSLRGQFKQANALGVRYVVILGEDELLRGEVTVRDMLSGNQEGVSVDSFLQKLDPKAPANYLDPPWC